jgi:hypothetical protein
MFLRKFGHNFSWLQVEWFVRWGVAVSQKHNIIYCHNSFIHPQQMKQDALIKNEVGNEIRRGF